MNDKKDKPPERFSNLGPPGMARRFAAPAADKRLVKAAVETGDIARGVRAPARAYPAKPDKPATERKRKAKAALAKAEAKKPKKAKGKSRRSPSGPSSIKQWKSREEMLKDFPKAKGKSGGRPPLYPDKPWEADGVTRQTWYRRKRKQET